MGYSQQAIRLRTPKIVELGRVEDRVSFLFLDRCRIEQTRTGVEAWHEEDGDLWKTTIPAANLGVLALGPGVAITTPALTTLHRCGTSVLITSADGLVGYCVGRALTSSGRWAAAQARSWADADLRRQAAVALYAARFPRQVMPEHVSLNALRGLEGHMVKAAYKMNARLHRVKGFKRVSQGATDPVNIALNVANSILYGLAATVSSALSLNPALGFIHEGNAGSLLFDLADVYKCEVTIPAAFSVAGGSDPVADVARKVRAEIHRRSLLPAMFRLTQDILTPGLTGKPEGDTLLDDDGASVSGHTNWHLR